MAFSQVVLYVWVLFSSYVLIESNSLNVSESILDACESSGCVCEILHYQNKIFNISWSELKLKCNSFKELQSFSNKPKTMTYSGEYEMLGFDATLTNVLPREVQDITEGYFSEEKKVFQVIEAVVNEQLVSRVMSDCNKTDETEDSVCFNTTENDDLKYITRLEITGNKLKQFGTEQNPILQLFPSLQELKINTSAETIEIHLVELSYLHYFYIYVKKIVKLYCAFDSELCLSNPKGLNRFEIYFENPDGSDLQVFGKLKFPANIDNLTIDYNYKKIIPSPTIEFPTAAKDKDKNIQNNIFKNIVFQNLTLNVPPTPKHIFRLRDYSGIKVRNQFTLRGDNEDVYPLLPEVYDLGLQYPLVLDLHPYKEQIPFVNVLDSSLEKSQFAACEYGEKLLKHAHLNEYEKEELLIIRSFHLTLSQIIGITKNYNTTKCFRVYTYNIDVDEDPSKAYFNRFSNTYVKVEIYYIKIGTSNHSLLGTHTFHVIQGNQNSKVPYRSNLISLQFISMKNRHNADPIFMRAAATCLIMNIGSYHKIAPDSLFHNDDQLSTWYDVIQESRDFNKSLYSELEISRTQTAVKYLEEYILWSDNKNTKVTRVPLLSLQVLSQNIQILAQAGRDIRDKSRHLESIASLKKIQNMTEASFKETLQSIGKAKIAILKASKEKSQSLGDIELRKQGDIDKQRNDSEDFINHLKNEFSAISKEVETESKNFKNGVILATSLAVAEAAAEAVNCIVGIFTGGFNPAKALNSARKAGKLAKIIPKLMKIMKTIRSLIQNRQLLGTIFQKVKKAWKAMPTKLSAFFTRQKIMLKDWLQAKHTVLDKKSTRDVERIKAFVKISSTLLNTTPEMVKNTVSYLKAERTVRIGFDPGNPLQHLATEQETAEQFKDPSANEAVETSSKLNAVDVYKWTIAKEHVTGMIDTTLSDDVPEATAYRTALLKLITTGETQTQASLNQAALETSFSLSRYAWGLYFNESVFTEMEIAKTEDELQELENDGSVILERSWVVNNRSAIDLDIEWEKLAIKLELVRLNEEYCNAFFYFHLEKCHEGLLINPSDDLEKILYIQNMLLYQSNQKLNEMFPPPQTFNDLTITIEKPKHCHCIKYFLNITIASNTTAEERIRLIDQMHSDSKKCLEDDGVDYQKSNLTEHNTTNNILMKCTDNPIENVKKSEEFIYKVDINSSYFSGRDRVRIDEVKVIFKGATTANGIVTIYAQSTGISEDRYKGRSFKFIGDRWIRMLSYYSKSAVNKFAVKKIKQTKQKKNNRKQPNYENDQVTFIDAGNVHKSFEGLFRAPTVFTTWSFFIPKSSNPGLNLTGLEKIELKFSGSFITTGYASAVIQSGDQKNSQNTTEVQSTNGEKIKEDEKNGAKPGDSTETFTQNERDIEKKNSTFYFNAKKNTKGLKNSRKRKQKHRNKRLKHKTRGSKAKKSHAKIH